MSQVAEVFCRCGELHGQLTGASPSTVNRIVCYCDDCQAFAHHLGRADLLDSQGGTDIVQVAPASLTFDRGWERIAGLRLTPKGLYRWYASCCKTPVGNTLSPNIPFVGIVAQAFAGPGQSPDAVFGRPTGAILGKYAVGGPPPGSTGMNLRLFARALSKVVGWRLQGRAWPHPFFDRATRVPSRPVTTLSPAEREALRPLCGPGSTSAPRG
jgi:uncharacterized protein DUF6151